MVQVVVRTIPMSQIVLDETVYPRSGIYPKGVSMFAEDMRDGFEIGPIEVQVHPDDDSRYRILDGAHRFNAYKQIGTVAQPSDALQSFYDSVEAESGRKISLQQATFVGGRGMGFAFAHHPTDLAGEGSMSRSGFHFPTGRDGQSCHSDLLKVLQQVNKSNKQRRGSWGNLEHMDYSAQIKHL